MSVTGRLLWIVVLPVLLAAGILLLATGFRVPQEAASVGADAAPVRNSRLSAGVLARATALAAEADQLARDALHARDRNARFGTVAAWITLVLAAALAGLGKVIHAESKTPAGGEKAAPRWLSVFVVVLGILAMIATAGQQRFDGSRSEEQEKHVDVVEARVDAMALVREAPADADAEKALDVFHKRIAAFR